MGFESRSAKRIILTGLSQIPSTSRLHKAISGIIENYEKGVSAESCIADIRTRWNEELSYHWCHTISNAEIVTAALLILPRFIVLFGKYASNPGYAYAVGE